jgi:hypothetical protein
MTVNVTMEMKVISVLKVSIFTDSMFKKEGEGVGSCNFT